MDAVALALVLASAALHAGWNALLAGARDTHAVTAVALAAGVLALAPLAAATWDVRAAALPYAGASIALELAYFALLATAYAAASLTTIYPVARGAAPVIALVISVALLAAPVTAVEAAGVVAVAAGVLLVRARGEGAAEEGDDAAARARSTADAGTAEGGDDAAPRARSTTDGAAERARSQAAGSGDAARAQSAAAVGGAAAPPGSSAEAGEDAARARSRAGGGAAGLERAPVGHRTMGHFGGVGGGAAARRVSPAGGLPLALAIAACIAGYTLVDDRGVRHAAALPYFEIVLGTTAVAYLAAAAARRGGASLRAALGLRAVLAGVGMAVAYVLVLAALERAEAAPVAALRETGVVMAIAAAALFGRERVPRTRIVGAAVVVAGVAAIALG